MFMCKYIRMYVFMHVRMTYVCIYCNIMYYSGKCVYVCMYVCIYVCMYVCTCGWMHICMYACNILCIYVCMYVMPISMYVCMYCTVLYSIVLYCFCNVS